jgi:8-oxo-dGTP diphosphatase
MAGNIMIPSLNIWDYLLMLIMSLRYKKPLTLRLHGTTTDNTPGTRKRELKLNDSNLQAGTRIVRIAAYGIIQRESQILLCRLSKDLPRYGGMWTLPGGGLEFGEHPEEGVVREVMEETGFDIEPTLLLGINSFTREQPNESFQGIQIFYRSTIVGGTLTYEEDGTTDMCQWHPINEVAELEKAELVDVAISLSAKAGS